MKLRTLFLITMVSFPACADDASSTTFATIVTTFSSQSSPSTNVTLFDSQPAPTTSGGGEDDTSGETSAGLEVTGAPTTSGTTAAPGDTSGDGTSTTGGIPPEPPAGCAHLVEVWGNTLAERRTFVVDASACGRDDFLELEFEIEDPFPSTFTTPLPVAPCVVAGGPSSPEAGETGFFLLFMVGDEAPAWKATLRVDAEVSDHVEVPAALEGQTWPSAPDAPQLFVRRREDWSWGVKLEHEQGCALSPA